MAVDMRHVGLLGGSIQAPTKYAFPTFEGPSNPHVLQSEIEASSSASLASSERRRFDASDLVEFTLRYPSRSHTSFSSLPASEQPAHDCSWASWCHGRH